MKTKRITTIFITICMFVTTTLCSSFFANAKENSENELDSNSNDLCTIYYQESLTNKNRIRFIAMIDIEIAKSLTDVTTSLKINDTIIPEYNITTAYKSIYVNGKKITADKGKCFVISNIYNLSSFSSEEELELVVNFTFIDQLICAVWDAERTINYLC